jgi:hypothetical protein
VSVDADQRTTVPGWARLITFCATPPRGRQAGIPAVVDNQQIGPLAPRLLLCVSARIIHYLRRSRASSVAATGRFEPCKKVWRKEAEEVVCLETPSLLGAIGLYYRDFHQMNDAEVTDFPRPAARLTRGGRSLSVSIDLDQVTPTRGEPLNHCSRRSGCPVIVD